MKKIFIFMAVTACSLAQANDIGPKLNELCEQVKTCAMQNMEGQNISPEIKAMMEAQFAQMCVPMQQQFNSVSLFPGLAEKAEACIQSKIDLSCEQLLGDESSDTAECDEYTSYAEKISIEGAQ